MNPSYYPNSANSQSSRSHSQSTNNITNITTNYHTNYSTPSNIGSSSSSTVSTTSKTHNSHTPTNSSISSTPNSVLPDTTLKPRIWRFHPDHIALSPSILDGLTIEEEYRIRRASCNHIMETIRLIIEEQLRIQQHAQSKNTTGSGNNTNIINNKYTNASYCEQ